MDDIALYRAGEIVAGEMKSEEHSGVLGWWSPTYGYKEPALTLVGYDGGLAAPASHKLVAPWRCGAARSPA